MLKNVLNKLNLPETKNKFKVRSSFSHFRVFKFQFENDGFAILPCYTITKF